MHYIWIPWVFLTNIKIFSSIFHFYFAYTIFSISEGNDGDGDGDGNVFSKSAYMSYIFLIDVNLQ